MKNLLEESADQKKRGTEGATGGLKKAITQNNKKTTKERH